MIAVIDYKMGNLASVQKALNYLGLDNKITRLPKEKRIFSNYLTGSWIFSTRDEKSH